MPGLDTTKTTDDLRKNIYADLEKVRSLRNRIAHHEPILTRNLSEDFQRIACLIGYRSQITADWMLYHHNTQIQKMLQYRPQSIISRR